MVVYNRGFSINLALFMLAYRQIISTMEIKSISIFAIAVLSHLQVLNVYPTIINTPTAKITVENKFSIAALTKNIEFAFCKANLPSADAIQLNQLAQFLTQNRYAIALRGHADAIGSYVGNWKMSEARANGIKAYLLNKGVSEERIVTTAFGSTIPIANNKTSKGRQKNRRVEIILKQIGTE
ncbi:OmpA family protein [Mucilaginibacter psychrotolerans]|uniref:OmpA family protein n=1 Tax=Mucilaginibacter psychrotolerans TaxID=1524096 RepID=A0A4Y8S495_9SPHI|nr:OmpA family protein [Mucilaginibacter psychrotolerans]TFF33287.1 OmpA family protein [Mucilaginibacter psychrotolerans]